MSVDTTSTAPSSSYTIFLSDTVKINDVTSNSAEPAEPSLAVDIIGNVYVAWSSGSVSNHDIYVAQGTLSSTTTTTTIATTTTTVITSTTSTMSTTPTTTTTTTTIRDITFGTPVRFDDGGTCDQRAPSIATDGTNVYVAWQDTQTTSPPCSSTYAVRAAVRPVTDLTTATTSFAIPLTNTTTPENQTEPSVALDNIGNLYIAWTDAQAVNNDTYFTKGPLDATITSTTPVRVNDPGVTDHIHPSLALDHNGNVYVAWQDDRNGNNDIFFAKSTDGGATFDAVTDPKSPTKHNIRVTDDTGSANHQTPSIVMENPEPNATASTPDKIYVAWQDNRNHPGSLIFDIFTAKSTDGGNTFQKNSAPANLPPEAVPTNKYNSSIAVDTFGRAYLIWTDELNNTGASGTASDVFFAIGQ